MEIEEQRFWIEQNAELRDLLAAMVQSQTATNILIAEVIHELKQANVHLSKIRQHTL